MDDRLVPAIGVIGALALLLLLMYLGFRARQRRQSGLPRPLEVPADTGARLIGLDVLYVASTVVDQPLERIAVRGLGFRARASVAVFDRGIALGIAGEPDAWLPAADIAQVDRSTWVIDRVVERGGLVRVTWRLGTVDPAASDSAAPTVISGGSLIDSYLRVSDAADQNALITAIRSIIADSADTAAALDTTIATDPGSAPRGDDRLDEGK